MFNQTINSLVIALLLLAFSYGYLKGFDKLSIGSAYVLVVASFESLALSVIQVIAADELIDKTLFAVLVLYSGFALLASIRNFGLYDEEIRKQYLQSGHFVFFTFIGIFWCSIFLLEFLSSR